MADRMTVVVKIKTVYGEDKVYPDCAKSELFAAIAGTRTLTESTLRLIKQLGYEIVVRQGCGLAV